ncbi:MAG: RrF2 family transcriptional regulator [Pirellulaceae bacterium]
MLCLSHTTGYAVLALSCLSQTVGQLVLAKDIAACTGIPLPYLSKLLHALHGSGLIHGKRGYRGGFMLARSPAEVSLLEVAEAVEGKHWLPRCLLGLDKCDPEQSCPTHDFWTIERGKIEQELRRVRLNDVAAFAKARGLASAIACKCDDLKTNLEAKESTRPIRKIKTSKTSRTSRTSTNSKPSVSKHRATLFEKTSEVRSKRSK